MEGELNGRKRSLESASQSSVFCVIPINAVLPCGPGDLKLRCGLQKLLRILKKVVYCGVWGYVLVTSLVILIQFILRGSFETGHVDAMRNLRGLLSRLCVCVWGG